MNSTNMGNLSDRDLLAALRTLNAATTGNAAVYGVAAASVAELTAELDGFENDLDSYDQTQAAESAAIGAKNSRRETVLTKARAQIRQIRAADGMTDERLAAAGLDAYDTVKTAAPAPTSVPIAYVDYGKLKHTIYFRDAATPDSEAKPKGMKGAEIWRFIGSAAPTDENAYDFVTLDSGSPYVAFYTQENAGKKVFYTLRWVSTTDEKGGWSETVEATING